MWMLSNVWRTNPNMLVPYYLMHSYLYYVMNEPIIEDTEYDEICRELKEKWNSVEHYHKHLIDKQSLGAGTGYDIKYNNRIAQAAMELLKKR
jgi:NAD-dependent DNA ligase